MGTLDLLGAKVHQVFRSLIFDDINIEDIHFSRNKNMQRERIAEIDRNFEDAAKREG